jgi:hypothetical protein
MSSEFIICETAGCGSNADLIVVYGCLNQHVSDVILCQPHYLAWEKSLPATICGACGRHIDIPSHRIQGTASIKMNGARVVLLRPQQQAQMKKRIRGLQGSWGAGGNTLPIRNIPSIPSNMLNPTPYTILKRDMEAFTSDVKKTRKQIDRLNEELNKTNRQWERTVRNIRDQNKKK